MLRFSFPFPTARVIITPTPRRPSILDDTRPVQYVPSHPPFVTHPPPPPSPPRGRKVGTTRREHARPHVLSIYFLFILFTSSQRRMPQFFYLFFLVNLAPSLRLHIPPSSFYPILRPSFVPQEKKECNKQQATTKKTQQKTKQNKTKQRIRESTCRPFVFVLLCFFVMILVFFFSLSSAEDTSKKIQNTNGKKRKECKTLHEKKENKQKKTPPHTLLS